MNILNAKEALKISLLAVAISTSISSYADQIIQDDLIVVGSQCIGVDCVNGESFNFDTLRLKENNLRIKFIDTSSSSSFPTTDWQITINDSVNGGLNKFSIEDVDSNKVPFTILAAAPTNSLFISSNGYIGFNTSTPMVNLHTKTGNTPTLRLEQDTSSGFSSQAWDVGGNETNFFVRDYTNGSKLPFRIAANAPNASIFIAADGDIGFETTTPDGLFDIAHPLDANNHSLLVNPSGYLGVNIDNGFSPTGLFDVQTTGGSSKFIVATDGNVGVGTNNPIASLDVKSENQKLVLSASNPTGAAWLAIENGSLNVRQLIQANNAGGFSITREDMSNGGGDYKALLISDSNGNLTIPGTLSQGSNVDSKENIRTVNGDLLLEKLMKLPISSWNYKTDDDSVVHIGPMAQEFFSQFGLGHSDKAISSLDTSGIAIAAIQALNKKLELKSLELDELKKKLYSLQGEK